MKTNLIRFSLFLALICLFSGCSDDFLKKNHWEPDLMLTTTAEPPQAKAGLQSISFTIPKAGNASYSVVQFPMWMDGVNIKGTTSNDVLTLTYQHNISLFLPSAPFQFYFCFEIDGIGKVQILVNFEEKRITDINVQPQKLDFGTESTLQTLRISNNGNYSVNLKFESYPEWISFISTSDLILGKGDEVSLDVFCDRSGMTSGIHTENIVLTTDSTTVIVPISIEVEEKVNKDLFAIEGVVKGVAYNKAEGLLYIATQAPNRIIVYNTTDDSRRYVSLSRAPKCVRFSEDGRLAFIGHSGLLSVMNVQSEKIISSIETDFNIFDLVYGENDWCYITLDENYRNILFGINIKTKQVSELTTYTTNFSSLTHLSKIKGKAMIVGSRMAVSPSGVILADITNPTNISESYWHEDFGRFWLSEDQKHIYGSNGNIFKTPDASTTNIYTLHRLTSNNIGWITGSEAAKSIWTVQNYFYSNEERAISRYETTDYTLQETIYPAKSPGTINGKKDFYPTLAKYIFADKTGNNLFIIKNIVDMIQHQESDNWSLEKINLKK